VIFRFCIQGKSKALWMLCLSCLLLSSCGLRTSPFPYDEVPPSSFQELQAQQYGDGLRISWKEEVLASESIDNSTFIEDPTVAMENSTVLSMQNSDLAQETLLVEEFTLDYTCSTCEMLPVREFRLTQSSPEWVRIGHQNYLDLQTTGARDQLHFFRLTRLDSTQGDTQPQMIASPPYVDFPPLFPPHVALTNTVSTKSTVSYHFRTTWKQQQESAEFQFVGQGELLKNSVFFKVNLYQKFNDATWEKQPLNATPIQNAYFIHIFRDQRTQEKFQRNRAAASSILNSLHLVDNHPASLSLKASLQMDYQSTANDILAYKMRWVSSKGSQSKASEPMEISIPRFSSLQHHLLPTLID